MFVRHISDELDGRGVAGDRVTSRRRAFLFQMLARTRLLRSIQRVCVRSLADKAGSDPSKAVPERTAAAGPLPGGE
jgi:hypothetical protein